jgi:hypothetical protein
MWVGAAIKGAPCTARAWEDTASTHRGGGRAAAGGAEQGALKISSHTCVQRLTFFSTDLSGFPLTVLFVDFLRFVHTGASGHITVSTEDNGRGRG